MTCAFCRRPLPEGLPPHLVRFEVTGWERERKMGGTNALELRTRTGAVAHFECVDRAKRGLAPTQDSLWNESES